MDATTPHPSRRQALKLAGGASVAAGAAVAATGAPASAAPKVSYKPGRYAATPVLSAPARHLVNRFSYGITPALADEVRAARGHVNWFEQQLETAYDGSADNLCEWWPDLHLDGPTLWSRNAEGVRGGWEVMYDYGSRSLMRRLTSPRQVLEVMTEFWENHFHVPTNVDNVFPLRIGYGEKLRANALGRFEDLLKAAALDPAMLMYLNASASTKAHPNENLGRELLELHTLGVGNYGEDDVKNSARILTGYRVDLYKTWAPAYQAGDHWTGPVSVLGFSHPNGDPDGQPVAQEFLSYLARHPATARRIATKLTRNFVSDDVPQTLVDRLAEVYLANDTAIAPVLRALVRSPEFMGAIDRKVRDGDEDVLATYRILGVQVVPPKDDSAAANQAYWQVASLGLAPYTWPRPDGQPVDNAAWSSPTRALASMTFHWDMASQWWPVEGVRYRRPTTWLPRGRALKFRDLVDHLSRSLLQRESTSVILQACSEATGVDPQTQVAPGHPLFDTVRWPRLVAALLDSPGFFQH